MSTPSPQHDNPNGWSDDRLDAAFQAQFDRAAPGYLRERIVEDLGGGAGARSEFRSFRGFARSAAAAAALVAALVFTIAIAGLSPSTRPLASTASAAAIPELPPVDAIGAPFPSTVRPAGFQATYAVLTVRGAVTIRDRGVDYREIAVGGWYVPRQPIPCPLAPDEYQPLEDCALNSSWLLDSPDQRPIQAQTSVVGPAINPVTRWVPPSPATVPIAVVFVGHFDDPGAVNCPAGVRLQRCLDRFVVDAVAWDGGASLVDLPTQIDGLAVLTVSQAIFDREMDLATELAVAGFYQAPPPKFCPSEPNVALRFLEGSCDISVTWFMEDRETIINVLTGSDGTTGFDIGGPRGPAITPVFPTVRPPNQLPVPVDGASTPTQAILIGHFSDRRASLCYRDDPQVCVVRFVVDAIPWVGGIERAIPDRTDSRDPGGPSPAVDPVERVRDVAAIGLVLNVAAVVGDELIRIEPEFDLTGLHRSSRSSFWIVTAMSASVPTTDTFVVDEAGAVFDESGGAFELLAPPDPSPGLTCGPTVRLACV